MPPRMCTHAFLFSLSVLLRPCLLSPPTHPGTLDTRPRAIKEREPGTSPSFGPVVRMVGREIAGSGEAVQRLLFCQITLFRLFLTPSKADIAFFLSPSPGIETNYDSSHHSRGSVGPMELPPRTSN
ncbi:hypothetical protein SUGI_1509730 [Cryptomeria japonica]|uniref:Secreted protein n=1 Tax=Cryptomeria japonica TaxID=3369 RepID=A0AAD3RS76_CRYJA|nr:hypothetical protein SUGI_1495530 [Cryptomeria japonica]GLJ59468.1 hypothetical protein SUGI_1509730 [Cryptomeria japonica]